VLEHIPAFNDETRKLQESLQILQRVLSTELRCVGALRPDSAGNGLSTYFAGNAVPSEVWVLLAQSTQAQPVFKILSSQGGKLRPEVLAECFPGLPLFAPAPGQELSGLAERLPGFQTAGGVKPERPTAWPINAWP
jgi:hypothetical protein